MPTKRNRAGQQQNYVPQGNGDASGEYADQASGSNKHFTNFKKPDEKPEETKQFGSFSKDNEQIRVNAIEAKKNIRDNLASRFTIKSRDSQIHIESFVETFSDEVNDEGLISLNEYLNQNDKLKIKLGGSGRNAAGCAWGYTEMSLNDTSPHVIKHELGHTFDNFYGKDLPEDKEHRTFRDSDYASCRFVDPETNKTMNEMIHDELGIHNVKAQFGWKGISFIKQGRDSRDVKVAAMKRIADVYTKYADKIFDNMSGVENARAKMNELRAEQNKAKEDAAKLVKETEEGIAYEQAIKDVYKAEGEYRDEMIKKGAWSIYYDNSPEVMKARAKRDELRYKVSEKTNSIFNELFPISKKEELHDLTTNYDKTYRQLRGIAGIVGDTANYMGVSTYTPYNTNGHSSSYFKDSDAAYTLEIFANMYAGYMSKSAIHKECIREMFPETVKIFEKIYNKQFK